MPKIRISDQLYNRLAGFALPFESPENVISRLLDQAEGKESVGVSSSLIPASSHGKSRVNTLRGSVIDKWNSSGRPNWDIEATSAACIEVDKQFEHLGQNPAPKFREARLRNDEYYMRTYVFGCHYPWLNPR